MKPFTTKFIVPIAASAFLILTTSHAQIPQFVIPDGVGVNIHSTAANPTDLDLIAAAGFKFVRMDVDWQTTEPQPGQYNWKYHDDLTALLDQRGIRALYILCYVNAAYEQTVDATHPITHKPERITASPRQPESIAAFARWAAAAAKHFHGHHIMWEIYNEPNGFFWKPKPDAKEYAALALATAKAIREADPDTTIVGPALFSFDWPFLETLFQSGVLQYLDGITVHPYRFPQMPPETTGSDYKKLRELIAQYAPPSKKHLPILSGEWGYASHNQGVSLETQAAYAVRQQLNNLYSGVPLSIWYDWKNDGLDAANNEHNFGLMEPDLKPKPAYMALQNMIRELKGYKFQRRLDLPHRDEFALLFKSPTGDRKIAAWTTGASHEVQLSDPKIHLQLDPVPKFVRLVK
jgi:polysaccharide biosynthesis protein PslG